MGLINNRCPECHRVFDLEDPAQANEWFYGHDCEDLEVLDTDPDTEPTVHPSWDYRLPVQFQGARK